jgi:hypothetical protein
LAATVRPIATGAPIGRSPAIHRRARQSCNYLQAKLIVLAAALPSQVAEFLSLLQLHYSSKVAN